MGLPLAIICSLIHPKHHQMIQSETGHSLFESQLLSNIVFYNPLIVIFTSSLVRFDNEWTMSDNHGSLHITGCSVEGWTFTPTLFGPDFWTFPFDLFQIYRCGSSRRRSGPKNENFVLLKEVVLVQIKLNHALDSHHGSRHGPMTRSLASSHRLLSDQRR